MRRAKQAAMLLTMAAGLGWSGVASDAQASRLETTALAPVVEVQAPATSIAPRAARSVVIGDGEWSYLATRR